MLHQLPKKELTFSGTRKTVRSGHIPHLLQEYEITMTTEAGVFCLLLLFKGSASCFFPEMVYAGHLYQLVGLSAWKKSGHLLHMCTPRSTQPALMCILEGGQIKTSGSEFFTVAKTRERNTVSKVVIRNDASNLLVFRSASLRSSIKFRQACVLFTFFLIA